MTGVDAARGGFAISTDSARFDMSVIHGFLTHSYWAQGIDEDTVRRAVANSLCFGVFLGARQIGFARVVTDRATFAYLADVFILEEFRGQGLARWMMELILAHPDLQRLRRWLLATRDAHGLYRQHGFTPLASPARFMERHDADVYRRAPAAPGGEPGPAADSRATIGPMGEPQ
jgi:GNAT superfamily N-acetyltransferase